ncbi:hypothetical protein V5799_010016, partial [Amblyomma americanum]
NLCALQVLEPGTAALKKQPAPLEPPEWPYNEHTVKVHTCAKLYQDWRKWKPGYQNAPAKGIEVDLGYLHTGLDKPAAQREGRPTVLLLHGAPGSYRDFTQLVPFLDSQGATVISPRWPGLHQALGDVQVQTLLYCVGPETRPLLATFGPDTSLDDHTAIISKFKVHFVHLVNDVYELVQFHRRVQQPGETMDSYYVELCKLCKRCNYR